MKILKCSIWVYAVVLLPSAAVQPSAAAILYSQAGYPNPSGGATSNYPLPISADDFTPDQSWVVSLATFKGAWQTAAAPIPLSGGTLPIRVGFYTDAGGKPTDPPFYSNDVLAVAGPAQTPAGGLSYFDFTMALPTPALLAGGQRYWFSVADPVTRTSSNKMDWAFSPEGNNHTAQTDGFKVWQSFSLDLTFSLQGVAVPEPALSSILIGAMALVGVRHGGRRRVV